MSSSHERVLACSDCIINNSSSMTKVKLAEYVHSGSLNFVPFYFFLFEKSYILYIRYILYSRNVDKNWKVENCIKILVNFVTDKEEAYIV